MNERNQHFCMLKPANSRSPHENESNTNSNKINQSSSADRMLEKNTQYKNNKLKTGQRMSRNKISNNIL